MLPKCLKAVKQKSALLSTILFLEPKGRYKQRDVIQGFRVKVSTRRNEILSRSRVKL